MFLFLKGGLGSEIKISFLYIIELKGVIVNEVLLEIVYIDFFGV